MAQTEKRQREVQLKFRVTPEERGLIEQKMALLETSNMAAYLRKMAIDGYIINLEMPELKDLISLLRRSSNNLNQLTKRVNTTGRIYAEDLEDIRQSFAHLENSANDILRGLDKIK